MSRSQSIMFVEILKDGTQIIYLTKDFEPATKETAELVKIIYPSGEIVFAEPVKE